jgi:uncharacterized protein YjbI with pentapeptide repeats
MESTRPGGGASLLRRIGEAAVRPPAIVGSVRSWIWWGTAALACFVGAGIFGYFALKLAPDWFASDASCRPGDENFSDCLAANKVRGDDRRGVMTATLAIFAGAISVFGAYVGARTFAVNREGQITERFTRAIDQLGSSALDVRLGGIYALERIARDSDVDQPQIVEILTAYIREHAPWPPPLARRLPGSKTRALIEALQALAGVAGSEQADRAANAIEPGGEKAPRSSQGDGPPPRLPTDVQAAVTVLGRRKILAQDGRGVIDLGGTDLRGADLTRAHFERVLLTGAHLEDAVLDEAHLDDAVLEDVHLERAKLERAQLKRARLFRAHVEGAALFDTQLQQASLGRAHLEAAELAGANLQGADFFRAHLQGARFTDCRLEGVHLMGAHLEGVMLHEAHLEGANLSYAHLEGAVLFGADLSGADLDGAHFNGAFYDDDTRWPQGFDREAACVRHRDEWPADRPLPGLAPPPGETET